MNKKSTEQNTTNLPSNYQLHAKMDLNKDKKINMCIQILFFGIVIFMIGLARVLDFPIKSNWNVSVKILITVFMCAVYMLVHELIHGIFFKLLTGVKPTYLVNLPFLCTGSEAYLNKKSFIIVALAPVVIGGLFLIAMLLVLPSDFFFSIYFVTVLNFAGAAGDYFQVYALLKLPSMALIQDNGKETKVFCK